MGRRSVSKEVAELSRAVGPEWSLSQVDPMPGAKGSPALLPEGRAPVNRDDVITGRVVAITLGGDILGPGFGLGLGFDQA